MTLHVMTDDHVEQWPIATLMRRGERAAAGLLDRGVRRGTPVAAIITNTAEACTSAIGTWLAGATLVSLPVIARGTTVPEYRTQLRRICEDVGSPLLLVEARYAPFLEGLGIELVTHEELPAERAAGADPPGEDDIAFVQYSSGSTRSPRGCALTTRAIAAQLDLLGGALELDGERDRGVSWLPLSHDLGFFGGLLNVWRAGIDGLMTTPERFLADPRTWLTDCSDFGATLTLAPALGLAMAARAARSSAPAVDLSLRACLVGGDVFTPGALELVDEVLGPLGLGAPPVVPGYGLAEATLGVTLGALGTAPSVRAAPADPGVPGTPVVSSGRPLPGVEVRIEGPEPVGEILVRSPAMALGYFGAPDDPAFEGGQLRTGDIGFMAEGELHVVGRADDVLKVGATKVWATEVESAIAVEPGIRAGNCVLVAVPAGAGERLVVIAEADGSDELDTLARRVARRALADGGVGIGECVFVRRGALPKTPSGKVQRYRCRQVARSGGEGVIARVRLREL
jgi:fatty-acyl-CoA synthase